MSTAQTSAGMPIAGYETVFLTKVEMSDELLATLKEKINSIVAQFGGEVITTEDWGKRKLAYRMKAETRAQYTYVVYTGKSGTVAEIERNLRLNEFVIRYLSVNLSKEFDKDAFAKKFPNGSYMKDPKELARDQFKEFGRMAE